MKKQIKYLILLFGFGAILSIANIEIIQFAVADRSDEKQYVIRHNKAHMLFINGTYLSSVKYNNQALLQEVSNTKFIEKKAIETDNALAPCALLANALLSIRITSLRGGLLIEKQFPVPIRGSNIFGLYDDAVADGKFFRQSPETKADILARMHIYWSGGIDTEINSLIKNMTQQQCLNYLLITNQQALSELFDMSSSAKSMQHYITHYAPVEMHGSTYTYQELNKYLNEVKDPKSLALSATETHNPVMPCSLMRGYASAYHAAELYFLMINGKLFIPTPNTPILGEYSEQLKGGRIPAEDPVVATRITAGYFVNQTLFWDKKETDWINRLSQQECLNVFITGNK